MLENLSLGMVVNKLVNLPVFFFFTIGIHLIKAFKKNGWVY